MSRNIRRQAGFTLLELLVVVAILAAIAGTATIALQDTDARASAAAHVAMMDEMNKAVRTYRVLNRNVYPNDYDALLQKADLATAAAANDFAGNGDPELSGFGILGFEDGLATITLTDDAAAGLNDIGITSLRYIQNDLDGDGGDTPLTCAAADLNDMINSRGNAVVAGNIFLSPAANGCGASVGLFDDATETSTGQRVAVWTGGYERVLGGQGAEFDVTDPVTDGSTFTAGVEGAPVLMAVGMGPGSTLFNGGELGGLSSVPVYRHVAVDQYNRFIALFDIGAIGAGGAGYTANDQVALVAIVDGAGDTKEEELGEWDGTRNTI